jgi:HlyD family secretion protein
VAAQSNLDIRTSETQSARDRAELSVTLANLALEAWREGEVESTREQLKLEKKTAQKDFDRLQDRYEQSKLLADQDFISLDELKQDEIKVIQAEARLRKAQLDEEVYETYTFEQDEALKTSDVEQAEAELKRVLQRNAAELETARANVESKTYALQSQQERLAKFQEQHDLCTVTAPADGWVVYASSLESGRSWRNNGQPPTVGTELRRNDLVIILPDTDQMIATVKVNESHSGLIEPGLTATVTSDAMPDTTLEGEVISIGVLAESGGWIDRNRRDYTVKIALKGGNELGLKPSMRCKAELFVGHAQDTLYVPVQAVFREGPLAFVYVPVSAGYAQRRVTLGQSSETYVEIVDGVEEGEIVLLREPRPQEVIAYIEDEPESERQAAHKPDSWPRRPKG